MRTNINKAEPNKYDAVPTAELLSQMKQNAKEAVEKIQPTLNTAQAALAELKRRGCNVKDAERQLQGQLKLLELFKDISNIGTSAPKLVKHKAG